MRSLLMLSLFAAVVISVFTVLVVNFECTGAQFIEYRPGMYVPREYAEQYEVSSGGSRPLPKYQVAAVDWNFDPTDKLFQAIIERSELAWRYGHMTEPQYNAMVKAIATLRLGIEKRCVSEQDVKVALRLLGGANKGERFKEQYEKARDCLLKLEPVKVEKPLPAYPQTAYEGSWDVFFDDRAGVLLVAGFNGTINVSVGGVFEDGLVEVVQNGFVFRSNSTYFIVDQKIDDSALRGNVSVSGRTYPVLLRRTT